MELFDVTERALEVALHGTELRQQVIANNLANVNTPNFKRSDVEFQQQLAEALQFDGSSTSAVAAVTPTVQTDNLTTMRVDGNNVDVDRESTYLAETQLQYSALMAVVTKNLTTMSSIITGAR
jgi:flagellar basal-body rod protein FlgB